MQDCRFIVDTDCGYDDLATLLFLVHRVGAPIDLITTVNGMVPPEEGAASVRGFLRRLQPEAPQPVVVGGSKTHLHGGRTLTQDVDWYPPYLAGLREVTRNFLSPGDDDGLESAPRALFEAVTKTSKSCTLICLGPLTNIAKAIDFGQQAFVENVSELFIMGGAVQVEGNMPTEDSGTFAEFNFWSDPKAATRVLKAGFRNVTLLPLDGCTQLKTDDLDFLRSQRYDVHKFPSSVLHDLMDKSDGTALQYDSLLGFFFEQPRAFHVRKQVSIDIDEKSGATFESASGTSVKVNMLVGVDRKAYRKSAEGILLSTHDRFRLSFAGSLLCLTCFLCFNAIAARIVVPTFFK